MTILVTAPFDNTPVTQTLKFYKSTYLKIVRLHINKRGILDSGEITLSIKDKITSEVLVSKTITSTVLNEITSDEYWHGMISFEFDNAILITVYPTQPYREYLVEFSSTNLPILNEISGSEDYNVPYVEFVLEYEKYISNDLDKFKYPPLYGDNTDGLNTDFANDAPIGIEIYTLS
jgi:hypothetical protein